MSGARCTLTLLTRTLLVAWLLLSCAAAHAQSEFHRYRNAEGREVLTNAGKIAVAGAPLGAVHLPELGQLDLATASPAQLQLLDRSIEQAHGALQNGERCAAIRASSRLPTGSVLWRQHMRPVCVMVLLLVVALLALAWGGRLRALMPLAPLLGALYLGYLTYARVEQRADILRDGLRACSSDLPPAQGGSTGTIMTRLQTALSLKATIDSAYAVRADSARPLRNR